MLAQGDLNFYIIGFPHYSYTNKIFRSDVAGRTNFGVLREVIGKELSDSSVRSQRNVQLVFHAVEKLNKKFCGNIEETSHRCFPDEYFTCPAKCKVKKRKNIAV